MLYPDALGSLSFPTQLKGCLSKILIPRQIQPSCLPFPLPPSGLDPDPDPDPSEMPLPPHTQVVDCLIQISDVRNRRVVIHTRQAKGQRREARRPSRSAAAAAAVASSVAAPFAAAAGGGGGRPSAERQAGPMGGDGCALPAEVDSETLALLAATPSLSPPPGSSPTPARFLTRALSTRISVSGAVTSSTPRPSVGGEPPSPQQVRLAIDLPPRRYLRRLESSSRGGTAEQQQQQLSPDRDQLPQQQRERGLSSTGSVSQGYSIGGAGAAAVPLRGPLGPGGIGLSGTGFAAVGSAVELARRASGPGSMAGAAAVEQTRRPALLDRSGSIMLPTSTSLLPPTSLALSSPFAAALPASLNWMIIEEAAGAAGGGAGEVSPHRGGVQLVPSRRASAGGGQPAAATAAGDSGPPIPSLSERQSQLSERALDAIMLGSSGFDGSTTPFGGTVIAAEDRGEPGSFPSRRFPDGSVRRRSVSVQGVSDWAGGGGGGGLVDEAALFRRPSAASGDGGGFPVLRSQPSASSRTSQASGIGSDGGGGSGCGSAVRGISGGGGAMETPPEAFSSWPSESPFLPPSLPRDDLFEGLMADATRRLGQRQHEESPTPTAAAAAVAPLLGRSAPGSMGRGGIGGSDGGGRGGGIGSNRQQLPALGPPPASRRSLDHQLLSAAPSSSPIPIPRPSHSGHLPSSSSPPPSQAAAAGLPISPSLRRPLSDWLGDSSPPSGRAALPPPSIPPRHGGMSQSGRSAASSNGGGDGGSPPLPLSPSRSGDLLLGVSLGTPLVRRPSSAAGSSPPTSGDGRRPSDGASTAAAPKVPSWQRSSSSRHAPPSPAALAAGTEDASVTSCR